MIIAPVINFKFLDILERKIKLNKITDIKTVRALCPEGYEYPGWTYELGNKKFMSYLKNIKGGPG